jgi:hypothetical protein
MHSSGLWLEDKFEEVATKKNFWKLCVRVMIAAHLNLELMRYEQGSTTSSAGRMVTTERTKLERGLS